MKIAHCIKSILLCLLCLNLALAGTNDKPSSEWTEADWEAWLNSDAPPPDQHRAINEGELTFITSTPSIAPMHSQHRLRVTEQSLHQGWVELAQCHRNLDALPAAQVIFKSPVRALRIESTEQIEKAWVEDDSVQLQGVKAGASLCLRLETKVLISLGDGRYLVRLGPYQRQFLDGFFPLQLKVQIEYPQDMSFLSVVPPPQTGLTVRDLDKHVELETLFEGRLFLGFVFRLEKREDQ